MQHNYFNDLQTSLKIGVASAAGVMPMQNPSTLKDLTVKAVLHTEKKSSVAGVASNKEPIMGATPATPSPPESVASQLPHNPSKNKDFAEVQHVLHLQHPQEAPAQLLRVDLVNLIQLTGAALGATASEVEEMVLATLEHHALEKALATFTNLAEQLGIKPKNHQSQNPAFNLTLVACRSCNHSKRDKIGNGEGHWQV